MNKNIYQFLKYADNTPYPPIDAKTYRQAVRILKTRYKVTCEFYCDFLVTPDKRVIQFPSVTLRIANHPMAYDLE